MGMPEIHQATPSVPGDRKSDPLIEVDGLTKRFPVSRSLFLRPTDFIHAVDDVSFHIGVGESLGLVGESGCGKSTVGKLLVRLHDPEQGRVRFRIPGGPVDADGADHQGTPSTYPP